MLDPALQVGVREDPVGQIVMAMNWRELLFLHFAIEPELVQSKLPPGLSVDTFPDDSGREMAWIGLVPFTMHNVLPRGVPRIQACSDFHETNVRTYVHASGRDPGVWFFSLDAANSFACAYARRFFKLPYHEARMELVSDGPYRQYKSARKRHPAVVSEATCTVGPSLDSAKPGTLEFFLIERYLLYSYRAGRLYNGQVVHSPYRLQAVSEYEASGSLVQAAGLPLRPYSHAIFSSGVDVGVGRLRRVI